MDRSRRRITWRPSPPRATFRACVSAALLPVLLILALTWRFTASRPSPVSKVRALAAQEDRMVPCIPDMYGRVRQIDAAAAPADITTRGYVSLYSCTTIVGYVPDERETSDS